MQFKRPEVVIGILIVTVAVLVTLIFQIEGWINVLANLSEIYLFGILLPTISFAVALIVRGFSKVSLPETVKEPETPQLPNIQGKIMGEMRGQFHKTPSETLTSFVLFVSLTNASTTPAHVRDYEFYVDIGAGFERMSIFRGISSMNFHFGYQGRELEITDFSKRLLSYQNKPIEFGIPFEGILLFGGDEKYYKAPIRTYKLICVDVFGQRHEIVTDPKDLPDIGFIADRFGVKGL
jgi:hypothetical protein